jgi:hypothetical protein
MPPSRGLPRIPGLPAPRSPRSRRPARRRKTPLQAAAVLLIAALGAILHQSGLLSGDASTPAAPASRSASAPPSRQTPSPDRAPISGRVTFDSPVLGPDDIAKAARDKRSDLLVQATATVKKVLPDDNDGDRHQKFIAALDNGLTLLVSHNIDLAPRAPVKEGDRVEFKGEYEWSEQGGVVHWTHHDPGKRRPGGWIKVRNKTYE